MKYPVLFFWRSSLSRKKTMVYVDGFNLYYGSLKNQPRYKWLNPVLLVQNMVDERHHDVIGCKYFTARVKATSHDPEQPTRQNIYFNALSTLGGMEIVEGVFSVHRKRMKRADGPGMVEVIATEEKGSDVNLAVHLVHDAHRRFNDMESAIIISNDSDLASALSILRDEIGLNVGVLSPYPRVTDRLRDASTFRKCITAVHLRNSQLPNPIHHEGRVIRKPSSWS